MEVGGWKKNGEILKKFFEILENLSGMNVKILGRKTKNSI